MQQFFTFSNRRFEYVPQPAGQVRGGTCAPVWQDSGELVAEVVISVLETTTEHGTVAGHTQYVDWGGFCRWIAIDGRSQ